MITLLDAVILCGGRGTRISGLYPDRPKALVPVAGEPFLRWQLNWLARGGIARVHLAAGHLAGHLIRWLDQAAQRLGCDRAWEIAVEPGERPLSVTLDVEPEPLGTGGGLKYAEPRLKSDPFLVVNGDSLVPALNLIDILRTQAASDCPAVMAVCHVTEAGRYGTAERSADGHVLAFHEKKDRTAGWVNAGVYLFRRSVCVSFPTGRAVSIEEDLFPEWAARGDLMSCPVAPPLLDMGTVDGLKEMERFLTRNRAAGGPDGAASARVGRGG